jgi:hypothetical protein
MATMPQLRKTSCLFVAKLPMSGQKEPSSSFLPATSSSARSFPPFIVDNREQPDSSRRVDSRLVFPFLSFDIDRVAKFVRAVIVGVQCLIHTPQGRIIDKGTE